jgi:hypothetical protein
VNPLFRATVDVQRFCDSQGWQFCFIGALADGTAIRTCSAEDLVVFKTFAARDQDGLDVGGVALRQAGRLDTALIIEELAPLLDLKGSTEDLTRLEHLLNSARPPVP